MPAQPPVDVEAMARDQTEPDPKTLLVSPRLVWRLRVAPPGRSLTSTCVLGISWHRWRYRRAKRRRGLPFVQLVRPAGVDA